MISLDYLCNFLSFGRLHLKHMAVEKGEKKTKNVFERKMRTLGFKEYDVMRYSMTVNG